VKKLFFNKLAFLLSLTLFFAACKKEESSPPVIIISAPQESTIYSVYDIVNISADISGSSPISNIKVGIVNESFVPAMSTAQIAVTSSSAYTYSYYIYDLHLASGIYYVWIAATDSKNKQRNAYKKIYINEVPLKKKSVCFITKTSSSSIGYSTIDSAFTIQQQLSFSGDYSGSRISSWHQQLYIAGKYTGNYNAIDLNNNTVKWSIPIVTGSVPCFTGVSSNEKNNYLSFYNGTLKAFDNNGSLQLLLNNTSGFHPVKTLEHSPYIIQEQTNLNGTVKKLLVHNSEFGSDVQETPITEDVVGLFKKNTDNIYLFGNAGNQGKMEIYTISGNSLWNRPLPSGKILSVAQVDSDTYLVGYDNGTIYKYTYGNNSFITYLSGINAVQLQYDQVNSEVLVAEVKKISSYDLGSAALKKSVATADTVIALHLLYNK